MTGEMDVWIEKQNGSMDKQIDGKINERAHF